MLAHAFLEGAMGRFYTGDEERKALSSRDEEVALCLRVAFIATAPCLRSSSYPALCLVQDIVRSGW